jgi:hypothetical protein
MEETIRRRKPEVIHRPTKRMKKSFARHKDMWEDNIKTDLREISFDVWHLYHTNLNEQQSKVSSVQPSAVILKPKP